MELNGLYYPYTAIHSMDTLTASLLYFDKIWLLSPRSIYRGRREYRQEVQEVLEGLVDEGLVSLIEPREALSGYGEFFTYLVRQDIESRVYRRLDSKPFKLYAQKITEEIYHEFLDYQQPDSEVFLVPFDVGEAVIINHVVLLCNSYGFVPFTDEEVHSLALLSKIKSFQRVRDFQSRPLDFKISLPALIGVGINDVVELRKDRSLDDFRKMFSEFSSFVQYHPLDSHLWQWISKKLEEISRKTRSIKRVLKNFQERRTQENIVLTRLPMKLTIHVGTPLSTVPFVQHNNGLSFFIDIRNLLPDRSAIRNISRITRDTIEGPPKTIQKGEANAEDLMRALKLRSQT